MYRHCAIQQGKIKSVDQKVFDFFPEYAKLDTGLKSALTLTPSYNDFRIGME